ncbi:MAG: BMP family ABC transporter substrate-binding protein [Bacteroidaceae bacterium]|nr:BMP family ABC transporter substrate-binding protein [Bacteroidaceae bacterium]
MKRIFVCILAAASLILASSCTRNEQEETVVDRRIVVLSSIGGMGDHGYNDLVISGLMRSYWDKGRFDAHMFYLGPETMEEAENFIERWIGPETKSAIHTLLVMCSSDYRDLAEKILANRDFTAENQVEMLVFEVPELPESQNSIKAYSFMIPMYQASYQAGVYAALNGYSKPLVWLADKSDTLTRKAGDGFSDGYKSVTEKTPEWRYLSNDWHGYSMGSEAYMQMDDVSSRNDFIFPVMGGSNMGLYRYMRENPGGPAVVGMDVDQSIYSTNVAGNILKHIDDVLYNLIDDWMNGKTIEHYKEYDTQSGYIEWSPVAR